MPDMSSARWEHVSLHLTHNIGIQFGGLAGQEFEYCADHEVRLYGREPLRSPGDDTHGGLVGRLPDA